MCFHLLRLRQHRRKASSQAMTLPELGEVPIRHRVEAKAVNIRMAEEEDTAIRMAGAEDMDIHTAGMLMEGQMGRIQSQ